MGVLGRLRVDSWYEPARFPAGDRTGVAESPLRRPVFPRRRAWPIVTGMSAPRSPKVPVLAAFAATCLAALGYALAARSLPALPEEVASAAALGLVVGPNTPPTALHLVGIVGVACLMMAIALPVAVLTRSATTTVSVVTVIAVHPSSFAAATHVRYAATPLADGTPSALGGLVAVGTAVAVTVVGAALSHSRFRRLPLVAAALLAVLWIPHTLSRTREAAPRREARARDVGTLSEAVTRVPEALLLVVPERDGVERDVAALVNAFPMRATEDPRKLCDARVATLVTYGGMSSDGSPSGPIEARVRATLRVGEDVALVNPPASALALRIPDDEPTFEARLGAAFAEATLAFVGVATDARGRHRIVERRLGNDVVERRREKDGTYRIAWRPSWRDPSGEREFRWESGDLLPHDGALVWTIVATDGRTAVCAPFRRVTAQR